jgi:hypothetical protein
VYLRIREGSLSLSAHPFSVKFCIKIYAISDILQIYAKADKLPTKVIEGREIIPNDENVGEAVVRGMRGNLLTRDHI